ncbi:MAG: hypothetical protein KAJ10_07400 [Thermodesulfovibrionia bacterium]|nr:hypothetical protein [Thermodesulfovibrionia bacterium]
MKSKKIAKGNLRSKKPARNMQRLRIALFTHDTFGLGHVRRSLHIIRELAVRLPDASLLLITGSPALHVLRDLPPNADYVKIPTVVKTGSHGSLPPHLKLSVPETTLLRTRIIKKAVTAFSPDIFIVDNFPLGSRTELLPVLQMLRHLPVKTILGLRDILDAPDAVQTDWKRHGIYDVLERYYDKILIYGCKNIFDASVGYNLSPSIAGKIRYCGYLTATSPLTHRPDEIRAELGIRGPFVMATGGGGGDAFPVLNTFVQALPKFPDIYSVIFTGPLMGAQDRKRLLDRINGNPRVIVQDFVPDLRGYIKAADVVVSMCGYNMAAEIIVQRPKAIVIPRTWKYGEHTKRMRTGEEREQIMRAHALSRLGFAHYIEPADLCADVLSQKISDLLRRPKKRVKTAINVQGLDSAVNEIILTAQGKGTTNGFK